MGEVVQFEQKTKKNIRKKDAPSKVALVLGGGGLTGGVYEIGALRALDLLSVNRNMNELDLYVGTSAGAFVATMLANDFTPEEMMRVVDRQVPSRVPGMEVGMLLHMNFAKLLKSGLTLPVQATRVFREFLKQPTQTSAMDILLGFAEGLPRGLYSGAGLEEYLNKVITANGGSDSFQDLQRDLYIVATDLDSCERVVFGLPETSDVPISTAVRASSALPMVYEPVEINGRELVDGGLISTTNLDLAVDQGAKLIIVINPLVPYAHTSENSAAQQQKVSSMGFPQLGYQAFKLILYERLHQLAKQWEQRYPGVDIVLIEPDPDDELMFETSVMNFTSRVEVARHGFRSVTLKLSRKYADIERIFARHGIELSAARVRKVVQHFTTDEERPNGWKNILEQTTGTLLRQSGVQHSEHEDEL